MRPETFHFLEDKVSLLLINSSKRGPPGVDPRKILLMTIWLMATPESYRSVADRFDVSKSTLWCTTTKAMTVIASLSTTLVKWPSVREMNITATDFQKVSIFPGIIGCIDGTFVNISAPSKHQESYVNRKNAHSVILQGVCDHRCRFIDCYAGEVASLHDARVFRRSGLGIEIRNKIPDEFHIIGDSAYPLLNNLLVPFRDNGHLTRRQIKYNIHLSKAKSTIERSFAFLKGRFRRLKYLHMCKTAFVPVFIMACCVMHNICQMKNDEIDIQVVEEEDEPEPDPDDRNEITGIEKRAQILQNYF